MDMTLVVVPIQCYLDVLFACPIACKFVVFFECVLEMLCMFFADVFDAGIINNQCDLYGSCLVLPKSRYKGPVGNFPPFFPTTHKITQQKIQKNRTDQVVTTAPFLPNPIFNESLLAAPFLKEFDSFCKDITDSGKVKA